MLATVTEAIFTARLVYWDLTPQQQPGSYQGGEMMMMKSVFWWRKPEYPEETTDLRQVTDETFHGENMLVLQTVKCDGKKLNTFKQLIKVCTAQLRGRRTRRRHAAF